jgi:hypothetical protein
MAIEGLPNVRRYADPNRPEDLPVEIANIQHYGTVGGRPVRLTPEQAEQARLAGKNIYNGEQMRVKFPEWNFVNDTDPTQNIPITETIQNAGEGLMGGLTMGAWDELRNRQNNLSTMPNSELALRGGVGLATMGSPTSWAKTGVNAASKKFIPKVAAKVTPVVNAAVTKFPKAAGAVTNALDFIGVEKIADTVLGRPESSELGQHAELAQGLLAGGSGAVFSVTPTKKLTWANELYKSIHNKPAVANALAEGGIKNREQFLVAMMSRDQSKFLKLMQNNLSSEETNAIAEQLLRSEFRATKNIRENYQVPSEFNNIFQGVDNETMTEAMARMSPAELRRIAMLRRPLTSLAIHEAAQVMPRESFQIMMSGVNPGGEQSGAWLRKFNKWGENYDAVLAHPELANTLTEPRTYDEISRMKGAINRNVNNADERVKTSSREQSALLNEISANQSQHFRDGNITGTLLPSGRPIKDKEMKAMGDYSRNLAQTYGLARGVGNIPTNVSAANRQPGVLFDNPAWSGKVEGKYAPAPLLNQLGTFHTNVGNVVPKLAHLPYRQLLQKHQGEDE